MTALLLSVLTARIRVRPVSWYCSVLQSHAVSAAEADSKNEFAPSCTHLSVAVTDFNAAHYVPVSYIHTYNHPCERLFAQKIINHLVLVTVVKCPKLNP
jgi:hypothetical protein